MATRIGLLWREGPEGSTIDVLIGDTDFPQEPVQVLGLRFLVGVFRPIKAYKLGDFCVCDLSG